MNRCGLRPGVVAVSMLWVALAAVPAMAQKPGAPKGGVDPAKVPDSYEALFERYLRAAQAQSGAQPARRASWMGSLTDDPRARGLNDVVTVQVVENITATGTAESSLSKDSGASAGVSKLFGLETKLPGSIDPASLASAKAQSSFKGSGATTRTGELTAVMTARVAEVLPNGDLVLEGVRESDINGDRQLIVLTGVVRPADINRGNVVLSTRVGQLSIRYFGRGLMKDNLKPSWLIRILNKIF